MRLSLLLHLLFICANKAVPISRCESSYQARPDPYSLTVNLHPSRIHDIPTDGQNKSLCSVTLRTRSDEKVVHFTVRQSSLPSPCVSHAVQVFEGPYQRTSWCETSTLSFRSLGSSLTIRYNVSSDTYGSFTFDYNAVSRSEAGVPPCDFISQNYNSTNHLSSKDAWWLCRTVLYAMASPSALTATKDEFFTVYPQYDRLTREWRILSEAKLGVYVEIENNPNLSCSLGVIKLYDCEELNYRYLGSWCNGRNNTFLTASCLALRFNATSLPSGSNTIFSLTYRYPDTTPWIPANHTVSPVCCDNIRTFTSAIQSQVLTIPALSRVRFRWRLTTEESKNSIELKVGSKFPDTRINAMCYDKYLEVFDGPSVSSPLLAKWCGLANQTLVSTGQHVFLVYTGGSGYPWLKWFVDYRTIVDGSVTDPASRTSSSSSQTGLIAGSVFGVVLLVLIMF